MMKLCTRRMIRFASGLMAVALCLSVLAACGVPDRSASTDAQHTVMAWCRLTDFPANRTDEKIEVNGSAITREFIVTFQAQPSDLAQWVAASPGLKEATLGTDGDVTLYTITPKDAAYCFARINHVMGAVYIKTYWS